MVQVLERISSHNVLFFVEELLFALLELFGEILLQLLFEVGAETLGEALTPKESPRWLSSTFFLVFAGAAAGLISAALFPHRMISGRHVVRGLSLILAPIGAGIAMQAIGNRLRAFGRTPSALTTFRGGATFAFAMALVRWLIVARPL